MIRENRKLLDYVKGLQHGASTECVTEHLYNPAELLIKQGESVAAIFIIKSGIAKCFMTEDNGKDFIQEFFGLGALFGEVEAINQRPSFCYIEAITQLAVYKIGIEAFHQLLAKNKLFNELILMALATKIQDKAHRHAYHQSHTIEENFLRLQNQFPRLIETISKQDIASYLGITLRSLNRTLHELQERGLVAIK